MTASERRRSGCGPNLAQRHSNDTATPPLSELLEMQLVRTRTRRSVLQHGPPVPELRPLLKCCIAAQICTLECLLYHAMLSAPSVNSPALRQPTQRKTTRPRQTPHSSTAHNVQAALPLSRLTLPHFQS
ncbi:hypothetical protein SNOG_16318 [Parastagonospora nodorum SN15]|uniref:Uncharacterized protein n=1 Tax=Phaeosphaeria nodorum (strain SN15 / ATCC MYA-4574 / FGSC 10173) TaxID=321614 RepID=Q0TVZ6_PHANO|nr:hypothetical protein SNOG_16318 [Parastagonospora nodorum SN15]EAT76304.1 hypothetical protein SNOG_16318 [Parastagonospora nodorum SN15]